MNENLTKKPELSSFFKRFKKHIKILINSIGITLGPKGCEIMVMNYDENEYSSSTLISYLKDYEEAIPLTDFLIKIISKQENENGDGGKIAALYGLILLRTIEKLINKNISESIISSVLESSINTSLHVIFENSFKFNPNFKTIFEYTKNVFTSDISYRNREFLAEICTDLLPFISKDNKNLENIRFLKKMGYIKETEVVADALILYRSSSKFGKDVLTFVQNALIGFINFSLNEIEYNDYNNTYFEICEIIIKSGCNVILVSKNHSGPPISYNSVKYLNEKNVMVILNISKNEQIYIQKAIGIQKILKIDDFKRSLLFPADFVEEISTENDTYIKISGLPMDFNFPSLIIRAPSEYLVDEIYDAVKKGISFIQEMVKNELVIPGGGTIELNIARALRTNSKRMPKMEGFCMQMFAKYFELIPKFLISSADQNKNRILRKIKRQFDEGNTFYGFDVENKLICDMVKEGIVMPLGSIEHALNLAYKQVKLFLDLKEEN